MKEFFIRFNELLRFALAWFICSILYKFNTFKILPDERKKQRKKEQKKERIMENWSRY